MKKFKFTFSAETVEIEARDLAEATCLLDLRYPELGGLYDVELFKHGQWVLVKA
jgi:hypothetical protein